MGEREKPEDVSPWSLTLDEAADANMKWGSEQHFQSSCFLWVGGW